MKSGFPREPRSPILLLPVAAGYTSMKGGPRGNRDLPSGPRIAR